MDKTIKDGDFWIENDDKKEFGFETLVKAKRRAKAIMKSIRDAGGILPFVQVIKNDNSAAWHWCDFAQAWHKDD